MDENETPPQRPVVSREFILQYRRRRFSDALAAMCSEKGFRDTTVADIVARAGTSRNAFYELFSNREEAFMTLMELGIDDLLGRVEAGCVEGGESAEARVEGGLTGAVEWVVDRPDDARACLVDAVGATDTSLVRQQEVVSRLATMLKEAAPNGTPRPDSLEEYLVSGVQFMLRQLIFAGEAERARELVPDLSGLLLAPYHSYRRRAN
jgi:AcrR family transcriptional regulator